MCSHESTTWEVTDNSVTDRMIENSLIHKFKPSRKVRRRTKVLNAEIKKYGVKNYKHYVELKTNILRNFTHDTDTDDSSSLTDVDYDIIYSSPLKQAKYMTKNFERYRFISEEDCEECKNEGNKNIKYKKKSRAQKKKHRNTERKIQTRKSPRLNTALSVNTGWQEVVKKSSSVSHLRKQMHTNILDNEGNLENSDHFKAQSSKQSLSSRFGSQNNISIMKSGNEYMRKDHKDSNAMDNESSSEDNTISNKTKSVSERKVRNHKQTNENIATLNESNIEFNSHGLHYQSSLSQLTNLENSNNSDNELNSLVKSEDSNSNKLTAAINESSINVKNYDIYVSHKSELLRNVKKNLISTLEKADSTNNNENIKTDNSVEDELNYDQLLPDITNLNLHSTPLKRTQTNISKDLSDTSSQDHQKDSGIDDDSQDKFVKIKRFNKSSTSRNVEENMEKAYSSPQLKKIDEVVDDEKTDKNCKEVVKDAHLKFNNDIIGEQISKRQNESSAEEKMKNSPQLNQIGVNIETNQEDEEDEHFVKVEDSNDIQNQLLSPKQDCMKETSSESCNLIQEEEDDGKIKKLAEKEEISFQLNKIDNSEINTEISSINYKGKQDSEEVKESSREEINFLQSSQVGNVTEIYLTNHENQTHFVEAEDSCNIQEQQLLPKIKCTEILNKKYKIIDKNDVKNNIEEINNINNNNMDIANEYTILIKKNTLIHCPDQNIDNWQKVTINEEEMETDNEEDNLNYMSPQTKKRLQQQARLNLIVSSDSNESDDEYITTSRKHIDSSDTSHCNENDGLKNETNCDLRQTKTEISHSKDISHSKEATVPTEVVKLDSTKEEIKKKAEALIRCTYENNDSFQSTTNKNPLEEIQDCENVHNDDHDENQDESFQLRISENNISCNNEESINQFRKPLLDKQNICTKSNEEAISAELEARHESEQTASVNYSNAHLNISRPRNLQQLVEDQELLVETIPASFTFSDLSEDEEAFILNVPSKVVQSNLQGQLLTLKEKSIKFNESKYRIVCKEVGNTSCVFATGKKRKPYKIVNIKKISTITIREKLPQDSRKPDVLNSYNTVFSMPKPTKRKREIKEKDSKTLKISNHKKRKRRESSDFDTEYLR